MPRIMNSVQEAEGGIIPRGRALLQALSATPRRAIVSLIAVHLIFLALLPFAVSSAPPLDIVEGLIWGQEWLIGTHKLPPGPAWLVEIALHLTGEPDTRSLSC